MTLCAVLRVTDSTARTLSEVGTWAPMWERRGIAGSQRDVAVGLGEGYSEVHLVNR